MESFHGISVFDLSILVLDVRYWTAFTRLKESIIDCIYYTIVLYFNIRFSLITIVSLLVQFQIEY